MTWMYQSDNHYVLKSPRKTRKRLGQLTTHPIKRQNVSNNRGILLGVVNRETLGEEYVHGIILFSQGGSFQREPVQWETRVHHLFSTTY